MIKGLGIDIIEIDRIREAVKSFGDRFLKRVYTEKELSYCQRRKENRFPELAARFAAKEAYSKANGTGMRGIHWRQIEVGNDPKGKPQMYFKGRLMEKVHVSLTHSRDYAAATVIFND